MNIRDILAECSDQIASAAVKRWPPLYTLENSRRHEQALRRLARRPFPAQHHVAAALAAGLKKLRGALLVGEPGAGKTMVAITAAAMLEARRVLVLAPAHLLGRNGKWAREITSTIPGARVEEIERISDVDRLLREPASPDRPLWILLSRDRAKLGSPWRPAFQPVCLYRSPATWVTARISPDNRLLQSHVRRIIRTADGAPVVYAACPDCGTLLHRVDRAQNTITYITADQASSSQHHCPTCGSPLWSHERDHHGRAAYPIGRYLASRARGAFDLLVVDEAHEYKGAGTAQGLMLGALSHAARATLAITATLTSGRPSSLFYLLHRTAPSFRRRFPYREPSRFARAYGVRERISTSEETVQVSKSGAISRKQVVKTTTRELPGLHPAILTELVDRTAFIHLSDLSTGLPPYRELVHTIPILPQQRSQYATLKDSLTQAIANALQKHRPSLLAVYLQAMLSLPDAPWRGEMVRNPETGEVVATVPPLDPAVIYPKEDALAELLLREKQAGRKALVYVTHTGVRDISARLRAVLESRGIAAEVLSASVPPRQRERWLEEASRRADAVIASPRLAGTGLDLVRYATVVWVEPEYSTYIIRQASRRTWRIGQTRPVDVHFLVYAQTVQEAALALVAQGILAASAVDGELSLEDRLAAHSSDGHILIELARTIVESSSSLPDPEELLRQAASREQDSLSMLGGALWTQDTRRIAVLPLREAAARIAEQLSLF
jgi:superfamily II DNA or RNA helicase